MKKIYTFTLLLFGLVASFAQTVIYSENFGTAPSGNPVATGYTQYQNMTAPIAYSGTADLRNTSASTGYPGASGNANVFFTNVAGRFLLIEGINTSLYPTADLMLQFGQNQATNSPTPSANFEVAVSMDGVAWSVLPYTRTTNTGWELITINSGIPSAPNLRVRFTQLGTASQYRVDDVKISAVSATCLLNLGTVATACAAVTGDIDTYSVTIPFTGGGLAVYSITASQGTISGDNPSTTASGNIVVSGINENVDMTVTITGGTCNLTREVEGISCKPINTLPYTESFDYAPGNVLGLQQMWSEQNSGDSAIILPGSLNYNGVTSTGNSVGFGGTGAETWTPFTVTTTGSVYASFLMNISDMSNVTTDGAQTYIAALTGDEFSEYNVRLFVRKAGAGYNIGLASGGNTTTNYTNATYNTGEVVMVIMGFDYGTSTLSAWINPDLATFTPATPATLTETLATLPGTFASFGGFILRQDTDALTPAAIIFDELRMATSLGALSVKSNEISGFAMYPNPVSGGMLTITSNSTADKEVAIYDMLGKEVVNAKTVNDNVNVSVLTSGIYMVKITEEGRTATRKLIVR